jgi:hypothetical protein
MKNNKYLLFQLQIMAFFMAAKQSETPPKDTLGRVKC